MSRVTLLVAGSALLLTSAAPPPLPDLRAAGLQDRDSPVRCRTAARDETARPLPVYGQTAPMAPPPPPSAPPPPPAPMPTQRMAMGDVAVSGARVRAPGVGSPAPYGAPGNTERYTGEEVAAVQTVADAPVSTFSIDVDTGAYANVRRFLKDGNMPPPEAVRTEEMINYFRYDYPRPTNRTEPFSVTTDVATTPWNANTRLMRIGLRGDAVRGEARPAANMVFLVDVSGSMNSPDKLPLVKRALGLVADNMTPRDKVSIVVYSGNTGIVLDPTSNPDYVRAALGCLEAGGSTAGGQGLALAYATARANFIVGGVNRIFLATDGDFNVGISSNDAIEEMVKRNRESGITLTALGFGTGNYNEAMMERIADVGNGNYAYIDSAMEAQKVLNDELAATLVTIAGDVKIQVEFNPAFVSEYRLIGYENRILAEEDFDNDAVDAGEIGAGHQVTALYEVVPAGSQGWLPERRYPANRTATQQGSGGSELAFVKLRYKLPGEDASRLISRPIAATALRRARAPAGDMAFVTAVAAFGQRLRGDKYLNGFGFNQIADLAGQQRGYWREEFGQLVRLAASHAPSSAPGTPAAAD